MKTLFKNTFFVFAVLNCIFVASNSKGAEMNINDSAPLFSTKTHEGKDFDLSSRKGQWTVLYFYPRAETPGCTKQACAFRDNIKKIRDVGADVFGVSADSVVAQAKFHEKHKLNFTLLADDKSQVIKLYGTKMPLLGMSKRWTFIVDDKLVIRAIDKDVDPAKDADKVAAMIVKLKST